MLMLVFAVPIFCALVFFFLLVSIFKDYFCEVEVSAPLVLTQAILNNNNINTTNNNNDNGNNNNYYNKKNNNKKNIYISSPLCT